MQREGNMEDTRCDPASSQSWIKLMGPAAGLLKEAFCAPNAIFFQDVPGERSNAEQEMIQEEKSKTVHECVRLVRVAPVSGGGCVHGTEKGTTDGVKPETVPQTRIVIPGTAGTQRHIKVLKSYRIVLLGQGGAGKSDVGNTIFGENVFSGTSEFQVESRSVHGRRITLINMPDLSDTEISGEQLQCDIAGSATQCTPGPHAFLIVIKVETFTKQQQQFVDHFGKYFPEEAFKHAAVVFTHVDQPIENFVDHNKCLSDLVKKCHGRCHVIDTSINYLSNQSEVEELLNTIDQMVKENKGCYTNKVQKNNTDRVSTNVWITLTGPAAESVAEAFLGSAAITHKAAAETREKETKQEGPQDEDEEPPQEEDQETEDKKEQPQEEDQETEDKKEQPQDKKEEIKEQEQKRMGKKEEKGKGGGGFWSFLSWLAGAAFGIAGALALGLAKCQNFLPHVMKGAGGRGGMGSGEAGGSAEIREGGGTKGGLASTAAKASAIGGTVVAGGLGFGWVKEKLYQLLDYLKQCGIKILLVIVFFSLLLLSLCLRVPIIGYILLMLLFLLQVFLFQLI